MQKTCHFWTMKLLVFISLHISANGCKEFAAGDKEEKFQIIAGATWEVHKKWDCGGNDISTHGKKSWNKGTSDDAVKDRKSCAEICLKHNNCVAFNYPDPGNGNCWTKHTYQKSDHLKKSCGGSSTFDYYTLIKGMDCCGSECVPMSTCAKKSAACGSAFIAKAGDTKCKTCAKDGDECCTPKTCAKNGAGGKAVVCGPAFAAKVGTTKCTTCAKDGAECCTPKTCAKNGAGGKAVTCGSEFTAKDGATKCTTCANDGDDCCTRKPCTITTLGSIHFDSNKTVAKFTKDSKGDSKDLEISGLMYKYAACVDPPTVTFEAYQKNKEGECDLSKSLSSVTNITGTPGRAAADITVTIPKSNLDSTSLGAAYSLSSGLVTIDLCVRARMRQAKDDILFNENNFVVQYESGGHFSVSMNSNRKKNFEVKKSLGKLYKSTAYQCDADYKEIQSPKPISQDNAVLRVCIEGESAKFVCNKIVTASLKQSGNGIEDKLIVDGAVKTAFTEFAKKQQFCMLTTLLPAKYFVKKTKDSTLQVAVQGDAEIKVARRLLTDMDPERRLDDQPQDGGFQMLVDVEETVVETKKLIVTETDKDPQSTTRQTVMGQDVDTAVSVYGIAVGTVMLAFMLM